MSPYKLIKGSDKNISTFEEEISKALADGYDLANDLVVQLKTNANGETETLLFQSLICDEAFDADDEDYDDEEVDEFEEEESEYS